MQADSYAAETNAMTELLSDIANSPELKSAVTTLVADELIVQLATSNNLFIENKIKRVVAGAAQSSVTSVETVRQLQKAILTVFNFFNSV